MLMGRNSYQAGAMNGFEQDGGRGPGTCGTVILFDHLKRFQDDRDLPLPFGYIKSGTSHKVFSSIN